MMQGFEADNRSFFSGRVHPKSSRPWQPPRFVVGHPDFHPVAEMFGHAAGIFANA